MADDLTFTDLVDFFRDHDGKTVYVEIGTRDQESRERHTDEFIAKIHGHRLGVIQGNGSWLPASEKRRGPGPRAPATTEDRPLS